MTSKIFVERAYPPVYKRQAFAPRATRQLKPGAALSVILLLSLGLWWVVWTVASALVPG